MFSNSPLTDLLSRADAARARNDVQTARELYHQALELDQQNEKVFYGLAWTKILDKTDDSIGDFTKAVDLNPNYAEAFQGRGLAHWMSGKISDALNDFEAALRLKPDYPNAYFGRGLAKSGLHRYADALDDFNKAVGMNANRPEWVHHERGKVKVALKDFSGAISDFSRSIELKPEAGDSWLARAEAKGLSADCQGAWLDYQTFRKLLNRSNEPQKNPLTIGCAILANDFRQHYKKKKTLLQVEGMTCLQRMLGVVSMFTREIVVITNNTIDFTDFPGVRIIADRYPRKYYVGGIFTALRNLDTDAVLVLRGDMPFIRHEVIQKIWDTFQENPKEACIPTVVVSKPFVEIRAGLRTLNTWPDPVDKPLHAIYHRNVMPKVLDFLAQTSVTSPDRFITSLDSHRIQIEKSEAVDRAFREIPDDYDENAPFPVVK